jgi:hypothetical protein
VTIHTPAQPSRLPSRFALGAAAAVLAGLVAGAVLVRHEGNSPTGIQARERPAISSSENSIRRSEATLERQLPDGIDYSVLRINATEDSIRLNEARLSGVLDDMFNVPARPVVAVRLVPPNVIDGPAYP